MLNKKFYNIEEMSTILGKTIASIYGHLARKQFDAVPVPMKLGRRLAWSVQAVDEWIERKMVEADAQRMAYVEQMKGSAPRKVGRPRKESRFYCRTWRG
ncbi:hypothetical protein LJC71_11505 [Desulfosarcina sp. OttesenSCG-928-A07]|nr:hypothetical protein [Desulfosarcina sp. OttesenSCG-928-G17]MDL2330344.1 hypothetical protein [Desulfosarcina sp. OttesenSCG-928-A07]